MKIDGQVKNPFQGLTVVISHLMAPIKHEHHRDHTPLCLLSPKYGDAPLSKADGQMGIGSMIEIDGLTNGGLTDGGYMIGTINQISEMTPTDA